MMSNSGRSPEKYARLKAEAQAPYRSLRKFLYVAFAASGGIGGFILGLKLLAGTAPPNGLPSFGLQIGVVALMIALLRWESRNE